MTFSWGNFIGGSHNSAAWTSTDSRMARHTRRPGLLHAAFMPKTVVCTSAYSVISSRLDTRLVPTEAEPIGTLPVVVLPSDIRTNWTTLLFGNIT